MRLNGIQSIYYSAWEADSEVDPLVPLLTGFKTSIEEKVDKAKKKSDARKKFEAVIETSGKLLCNSLPKLGAALATTVVPGVGEALKVLESTIEDVGIKLISEYQEKQRSVKKFKKELSDFVAEYCGAKPLVIIIDELDRCRPEYAIRTLERAKHLFDVPGVVFVLSVNRNELARATTAFYGEGTSGDDFLKKIIDIEYNLPEPPKTSFRVLVIDQLGLNISRANPQKKLDDSDLELLWLNKMMSAVCDGFGMSLRDEYQCLVRLKLISQSNESTTMFPNEVFFLLIALRHSRRSVYESLRQGADMTKFFSETEFRRDVSKRDKFWLMEMMIRESIQFASLPSHYAKIYEQLNRGDHPYGVHKDGTDEEAWAWISIRQSFFTNTKLEALMKMVDHASIFSA